MKTILKQLLQAITIMSINRFTKDKYKPVLYITHKNLTDLLDLSRFEYLQEIHISK